eukprot:GHVU01034028.1.p1 GENE.GHVU01034028.1~~GHVU01034028.1.p1  ORF type:complete len:171 (-),score=28.50 GHVU01034028.1:66-578(-)
MQWAKSLAEREEDEQTRKRQSQTEAVAERQREAVRECEALQSERDGRLAKEESTGKASRSERQQALASSVVERQQSAMELNDTHSALTEVAAIGLQYSGSGKPQRASEKGGILREAGQAGRTRQHGQRTDGWTVAGSMDGGGANSDGGRLFPRIVSVRIHITPLTIAVLP